jgi:hypothetical protein
MYQILKGGLPSLIHSHYNTETEAIAEVERLENIRATSNKEKANDTDRSRGWSFRTNPDNNQWSYRKVN